MSVDMVDDGPGRAGSWIIAKAITPSLPGDDKEDVWAKLESGMWCNVRGTQRRFWCLEVVSVIHEE